MEILFLLIVVPLIIGVVLGVGFAMLTIIGSVIVGLLSLIFQFWYVSLIAIFMLLFPILYLNHWLFWVLIPIVLFVVAMVFVPVAEDQKSDIAKAKLELKANWNHLISKF